MQSHAANEEVLSLSPQQLALRTMTNLLKIFFKKKHWLLLETQREHFHFYKVTSQKLSNLMLQWKETQKTFLHVENQLCGLIFLFSFLRWINVSEPSYLAVIPLLFPSPRLSFPSLCVSEIHTYSLAQRRESVTMETRRQDSKSYLLRRELRQQKESTVWVAEKQQHTQHL